LNAENPIGVFDSGIGGLTVAHAISQSLPNEKIIYFGDTQHLPYGNKSSSKIIYYSEKIADFLLSKDCKSIIIACNSASSIAFENLQKKTDEKCLLFNVIEPAIQSVVNDPLIKHVGVIGTNATISSNIYERHILAARSDITISSLATPLLASLIEENNNDLYKKGIIESYLKNKKLKNIDSLILGCTHYPLIKSYIENHYKKGVKIISALKNIGSIIKKELEHNGLLSLADAMPKHHFYVSDYTNHFQQKTKIFFPSGIILEEENIFS
jgi:glutamate racemase